MQRERENGERQKEEVSVTHVKYYHASTRNTTSKHPFNSLYAIATTATMPNDCPPIDISQKEDAAFFFDQVRKNAIKLVKQELARDHMEKDKKALAACQKSIDEVRCQKPLDWIEWLIHDLLF